MPSNPIENSGVAGYLKASSQGNKLAIACYGNNDTSGFFELFNFNYSTGSITQTHVFPMGSLGLPLYGNPYGIEFSPNGNYFYGSMISGGIYQFNTTNFDVNQINSITTPPYGALQLAVDGNIYVARQDETYLSKISNPNASMPLWIENGVSLGAKQSTYGLPSFVQCAITSSPSFNTSIESRKIGINIYPNPAIDELNIDFNALQRSDIVIRIHDMQGRLVKQIHTSVIQGLNHLHIDISELAKGMYSMKLSDSKELNFVKTFTKQ